MKSKYLVFAGIGAELVGIILGCLFVGQKIDSAYGLNGLAMVGLSLLGLAGWLYRVVRLTQKMEKSPDDE